MGAVINLSQYRGFACETDDNWKSVEKDWFQRTGFCDWVSIYQRHNHPVKKVNDGAFMTYDKDGVLQNVSLKREKVEGSHSSSIKIRSDGEVVEFEGNVSKWNRPDNVFGLSFESCLNKINQIMESHGLPPFTEGTRFVTSKDGNPVIEWTGARVTRLDVTENFSTGGKDNASHFMRWLEGQQASRTKTQTYGNGETVSFGGKGKKGSRHSYFKVYYKAQELRDHARDKADPYIIRLADWAEEQGIVRAELTLHSRKLRDLGCSFLGGFNMKLLEAEFARKCEVFTRADAEVDELPKLPMAVLGTLRMWENGDDIMSVLSRATFYRHRAALLPHGIDIAIKSSVTKLKMRTRVITLGPVAVPEWYQLEERTA